jgi:hypothetical protein
MRKLRSRSWSPSRRHFLAHVGSAIIASRAAISSIAHGGGSTGQDPAWATDSWDGWMTVDGDVVPEAWERKDGIIHLRKTPERTGHIVTRREYGDFTLRFEWRIAPGGNNGIKYRVRRYGDRMLGCEYQIYDAGIHSVDPKNQTGSIYDLYEPVQDIVARPPGEWNSSLIRVQDNRIEHWLHNYRIVSATIGDTEWERRISESKFNEYSDFAKNQRGRIMLTDHGSEVWYRNFEFTEL